MNGSTRRFLSTHSTWSGDCLRSLRRGSYSAHTTTTTAVTLNGGRWQQGHCTGLGLISERVALLETIELGPTNRTLRTKASLHFHSTIHTQDFMLAWQQTSVAQSIVTHNTGSTSAGFGWLALQSLEFRGDEMESMQCGRTGLRVRINATVME